MDFLFLGQTVHDADFSLPADVLTHTMAILAKKGAGKTYAAGVLEEEMAEAGLPFVVLDPVGVHWGIRSQANGKASGYPIVVFGGEHGDIPIERRDGVAVARAIIEENVSSIIDLSELSKGAWREFVRDCCRELYRLNKTPRHVFIEEATEFVPQTRRPEMQEAYEAVERLVRMGRNRGLGITLISQRSAQVAKDVLSQIDVLIALRTVGPHDRKAVLDMFETVLEDDQLTDLESFRRSIASLPDGTAWIWSPELLRCFTQVVIRQRRTYHAGATPSFESLKVIQARPDVASLRARLEAEAQRREEKAPKKAGTPQVVQVPCQHEEQIAGLERSLAEKNRTIHEQAEKLRIVQGEYASAEAFRTALRGFIGPTSGNGASFDEAAIVDRVLARLPSNGAPAVQITPPEALRKKYLEQAAERLLKRVASLGADAHTVMELLLGQPHFWTINAVAKALSGNDSGGTRERWAKALKECEMAGIARRGGSGRTGFAAGIDQGVEAELAQHGANPDELDVVKRHVLARIVQEGSSPNRDIGK